MNIPLFLRKLIGTPILKYRMRTWTQFIESTKNPQKHQIMKLKQVLSEIEGSEFAKKFRLSNDLPSDAFHQAIEVAGYERMRPWVDRVLTGDREALFSKKSELLMFALTSGTTALSKHIPITRTSFEEYRRSWTVWGCGVARDWPDIPNGGVLNFASTAKSHTSTSGIPIGSISGMLFRAMHYTMRFTNSVPPYISDVEDTERRLYLALRLALTRQDTMMLTTANPSTLISVAKRLELYRDDLIRDISDGTLLNQNAYNATILKQASSAISKRHKNLAKRLERDSKDNLTPKIAWPSLQLLGVWTGGTLVSYLPEISRLYGDSIKLRDHGLSASEARMTIPFNDQDSSGVLNLDGAYYEFIPVGEYEQKNRRTLQAWDLRIGEDYYIIISTCGGMIRYDISDVVRCTGFLNQTPCLQFLNKGSQIGNLTGEKLSAWQAIAGVSKSVASRQLPNFEYSIMPKFDKVPHYVILIENFQIPAIQEPQSFLQQIDQIWMSLNIEYNDKRRSGRLAQPKLLPVENGFFAKLKIEKMQKQGGTFEQYKHPFFSVDQKLLDKISERQGPEELCS
jgi:hypothetical protein